MASPMGRRRASPRAIPVRVRIGRVAPRARSLKLQTPRGLTNSEHTAVLALRRSESVANGRPGRGEAGYAWSISSRRTGRANCPRSHCGSTLTAAPGVYIPPPCSVMPALPLTVLAVTSLFTSINGPPGGPLAIGASNTPPPKALPLDPAGIDRVQHYLGVAQREGCVGDHNSAARGECCAARACSVDVVIADYTVRDRPKRKGVRLRSQSRLRRPSWR